MIVILKSPFLQVLKKLDLTDCNWKDQENCMAIATIIAKAGSLEETLLTTCESDRDILVERKPGTKGRGYAKVSIEGTGKLICEYDCETT